MVSPGPMTELGGLVESVYGSGGVTGAVLHVVDGHGYDVAGLGQRGPQPNAIQGYASAGVGGLLQRSL